MKVMKKIALVVVSALVYYLVFYLNKLFFGIYEFSYGVNWIFIPSGIQLLLVLVAGIDGALGIFLASLFIGLENYFYIPSFEQPSLHLFQVSPLCLLEKSVLIF